MIRPRRLLAGSKIRDRLPCGMRPSTDDVHGPLLPGQRPKRPNHFEGCSTQRGACLTARRRRGHPPARFEARRIGAVGAEKGFVLDVWFLASLDFLPSDLPRRRSWGQHAMWLYVSRTGEPRVEGLSCSSRSGPRPCFDQKGSVCASRRDET